MLTRHQLENLTRPRIVHLQRYKMHLMPQRARRKFEIMLALMGPRWDVRVLSRESLSWINRLYLDPTSNTN
jgi:hypothetical protein